jgi:hypothetical protein
MTRTRRRKHYGDPGIDRDGAVRPEGQVRRADFTVEVTRRERREREAQALALRTGSLDPDDTASKPARRRLWQLWRRW